MDRHDQRVAKRNEDRHGGQKAAHRVDTDLIESAVEVVARDEADVPGGDAARRRRANRQKRRRGKHPSAPMSRARQGCCVRLVSCAVELVAGLCVLILCLGAPFFVFCVGFPSDMCFASDGSPSHVSSHFQSMKWTLPRIQQLAVWAISTSVYVWIIYTHIVREPHPKFRITCARRMSLTVHAIFGGLECIIGVGCFFFQPGLRGVMVLMLAGCAAINAAAEAFQTPFVFGVRLVTIPAFMQMIFLKISAVVWLLLRPHSLDALLAVVLMQSTYPWIRIFTVVFRRLDVLRHHQYTIAVLLANAVCFPAAFGSAVMVAVFAGIMVYVTIQTRRLGGTRTLLDMREEAASNFFTSSFAETYLDTSPAALAHLVLRVVRHSNGDDGSGGGGSASRKKGEAQYECTHGCGFVSDFATVSAHEIICNAAPLAAAVSVFRALHSIRGGNPPLGLFLVAAKKLGVTGWPEMIRKYFVKVLNRERVSFALVNEAEFDKACKQMPAFLQTAAVALLLEFKSDVRHFQDCRGELIFALLDTDHTNTIQASELRSLLIAWGMPASGGLNITRRRGKKSKEGLDLEDFETCLGNLPSFLFEDLVKACIIRARISLHQLLLSESQRDAQDLASQPNLLRRLGSRAIRPFASRRIRAPSHAGDGASIATTKDSSGIGGGRNRSRQERARKGVSRPSK